MIPAAAGSYPRRDGNLVSPLIGGAAAFARIAEAVDAACERVWLTVAFYADDFHLPDGRSLFELLENAAARGVDVRIVFWRPNPDSINYGRVFGEEKKPGYDEETMETNVPGIFLAGTAIAGSPVGRVRIIVEDCHVHVPRIVNAISARATRRSTAASRSDRPSAP